MTKQKRRNPPISRDKAAVWPTPAESLAAERQWSTTHTWEQPKWTIEELVAAKGGRTVSVVLPA